MSSKPNLLHSVVAKESKKTRTETSNLLEKGLIQKNRFGVSDTFPA